MSDLGSFAQLIKQANEEKQARLVAEAEKKLSQAAPLLTELFSSVKQAKQEKKEIQKKSVIKNAPLLQELQQALTASKQVKKEELKLEPIQFVEEVKVPVVDIDVKIDQAITEADKRFLKLHNRLQSDLQALKRYVDNKPSTIVQNGGTSGGGEVRILRMDDIDKTIKPAAGDTLVWSTALNKFELKSSGGTTVISDEEMAYSKRVDFVTENEIYKAEAAVGTAETASLWRIRKVIIGSDSDVTEIWASGTAVYDKRWSDRLTYTYI